MKGSLTLILLSLFSIQLGFGQINTPSGATVPFGTNTSYEYGMMPTNLPTNGSYGQSSEVATLYNSWKTKFVENCGSDKARVKFDNTAETVSEGIAYGMLLAVYAADKNLFDRLWAYYKNFRNNNGVMHWKISGCNSVSSQNGATDAELDAAMALIVATVQWPNSTSPHNYKTDGVALINAIKNKETAPDGTFYNGDMWHPDCRNPSYQAPAYARAFKQFMSDNGQNQDSFWENVAAKTESLHANNAHSSSGLSTNWCTPAGPPSGSCSGSGTAPDKFGYDACRAPWRQGVDMLWWGASTTGQIQTIINRQADFWINKGGAGVVQGSNNMNHDGSGSGDHNGAFTGPIGAMALAASTTTAHQNFVNGLYSENKKTTIANGYFTEILQMIGLFVQTGNFWNPYGSVGGPINQSPTVALTSPANNASVCEGVTVTISANASDSDGSISKVEFYDGTTLLGTDNTSPYSYNWTTATSGTKTITAKAFDNTGATTVSTARTISIKATPNAPGVQPLVDYCVGDQASPVVASGTSLKWYSMASGGNASTNTPTPSTNNQGTTYYYVSQTVNSCESERSTIQVNVGQASAKPAVVSPVNYCQYVTATPLTASGQNLKWYTSASGSQSMSSVTPSTNNVGTTTYYVSQNAGGCESTRSSISVIVAASPSAPTVTSAIVYEMGDTPEQLSASGSNLKWYTSATGGTGSSTAPTPSTSTKGVTNYYVTQTNGSCESPRAKITVTVSDALKVQRAESPITVDGTIDAVWSLVEPQSFANNTIQGTVSNANDLSGTFKLLWDNSYLYVLGQVTDDSKTNDSGPVYQDDAIEVYVDFGNDKSTTYGNDDSQYTFGWNDNTIGANTSGNTSTTGISFQIVATSTGYVFEARIPWSTLGGTPVVGELHGFDFHVNDDDDGGDRDGKLSWNATTDDAWQNPSLFGEILLSDVIANVNDDLFLNSITTYPNPFESTVHINGLTKEVDYFFTDISGRIIQSGTTDGIIVADFDAGVYNLILNLEAGKKFLKLVKVD